jgi:hypothetical protein
LGLIGLALVVGSILSGLGKVWRHLLIDYTAAVQRLCFIVTIAAYNYTEATFHGVSNLWLVFFLGVLDMPRQAARGRVPATAGSFVEKIELVSGAAAANVSRLESDGHRQPFVREDRIHGSGGSGHRRDG